MNKSKLAKLVEEDFGLQGNGRWLKGIKHDSLVVDVENDFFYWNKNDVYGGVIEYLLYVRKLPIKVAKQLQRKIEGKCTDTLDYSNTAQVIHEKLVDVLWTNGKTNRSYWYKRLLNDSTIDRFKLGFYNNWYTIPIFENGKLTNIQKRMDEPEKMIRVWYRKPPVLFNSSILNIVDTVYLAEGIVDCILLNQLGIPAISKSTGASGWLKEWAKNFTKMKRVYVIFDNDDAGRSGAKKIARILGEYKCKIYTFKGFKERYDVIDFFRDGNDEEDFKELVKNESRYSFEI